MSSGIKPNHVAFLKSFSDELRAVKDRVRNLIGSDHWGEEGRYKELILTELLKSQLPQSVGVGTGFVLCDNGVVSSQIDIILYDRSKNTPIFKKGDLVIVASSAVIGIIEVKTTLENTNEVVDKVCKNKLEIEKGTQQRKIFAYGYKNRQIQSYFSSRNGHKMGNFEKALRDNFTNKKQYIDCLCFNKNYFVKFWDKNRPYGEYVNNEHYSTYEIANLSYGYFISNIKEYIQIFLKNKSIDEIDEKLLYPIPEDKKEHRKKEFDIVLN